MNAPIRNGNLQVVVTSILWNKALIHKCSVNSFHHQKKSPTIGAAVGGVIGAILAVVAVTAVTVLTVYCFMHARRKDL